MDRVRFGIIGLGNIGAHHVSYLNSVDNALLTAVSDADPAKLDKAVKQSNAKGFLQSDDLLNCGLVDAVLIATPHYFHPKIAKAAFARDIHVLCEKPVAVTTGAARELNAIHATKPKLKFALMFQTRLTPMYKKARDLVATGELGAVTRITMLITDWFRTWAYYASGGWRATWEGEGGGVLLNQCPHHLDMLQWIPDMTPSRVTAIAFLGKTHPIEVEDEASAILEYPNGAIGHFAASTGEFPGSNYLEIAGERGKLILSDNKIIFHQTRRNIRDIREQSHEAFPNPEVWSIEVPLPKPDPNPHKTICDNFVKAILRNDPLIAPGEDGVKGLEIGNAILMSGLRRQSVELPLDAAAYEALIQQKISESTGQKKLATKEVVSDISASFKH